MIKERIDMREKSSLRTWQKRYRDGDFSSTDVEIQIEAGWYDWFCDDKTLKRKTDIFAKSILMLTDSKRINLDSMHVWFNGNCPFDFPIYDDFRISDKETGKVLYAISRHDPFNEEKCLWSVYAICENLVIGKEGYPTHKCYSFKTTKQLVKWFNEQ